MNYSILFGSSLTVCLVLTMACRTSIPSYQSVNTVQANNSQIVDPDLERNRQLWNQSKITDYNMTISSAGEGGNISYPVPALIEVQDDKAISISVNSKSDEKLVERYQPIDTINKMFNIIQEGVNAGAKVEVKYNNQFGYPESLMVNNLKRGVHGWIIVKISKFEVVK